MDDDGWHGAGGFLALQLVGDAVAPGGIERAGATLLVLVNGGDAEVDFPLGGEAIVPASWQVAIDTDTEDGGGGDRAERTPGTLAVAPRSVLVARCYTPESDA